MGNNIRIQWNEKALRNLIQPAMDSIASEYSEEFEKLRVAHTGDPVEVIKPKVAQILRNHDGTATDAEITTYARLISEGTRISFETDIR